MRIMEFDSNFVFIGWGRSVSRVLYELTGLDESRIWDSFDFKCRADDEALLDFELFFTDNTEYWVTRKSWFGDIFGVCPFWKKKSIIIISITLYAEVLNNVSHLENHRMFLLKIIKCFVQCSTINPE